MERPKSSSVVGGYENDRFGVGGRLKMMGGSKKQRLKTRISLVATEGELQLKCCKDGLESLLSFQSVKCQG